MNRKPAILISTLDAERLENLLDATPAAAFPGKARLEDELARAELVAPQDMPGDVVTMNSTVRFRVDAAAEEFVLTLVYPKDNDGSGERISILAPVGSALLGLATGDEIDWPSPGKGMVRVRIVDIPYQPERLGHYHL